MSPRFLLLAVLLAGAAAIGATAHAQVPGAAPGEDASQFVPVEVDALGHGISRDAAISNALATALAQETGVDVAQVNLSGTVNAQASATETTSKTKPANALQRLEGVTPNPKTETTAIDAKLSGERAANITATASGGRVQRYQVLSVDPAQGGGFDARVHAVLAIMRRQSGAGISRRRIAVAPFTGDNGEESAELLRDRLVMDLTQTRRFAVVDRSHDEDYAQEMAVLQSQAPSAERSRAGQALGADYILTGRLHATAPKTTGHAAITTTETLSLTGEVISHTAPSTLRHSAGSSDADFELIEIATRQIILADHFHLSGNNPDAVAQQITSGIIDAIYPPRLVSMTDPSAVVINQGGDGIHCGDHFRIMQMGEELTDPYTHESLGRTEHEIGELEVTDVQPKISYAKLISGQLPPSSENATLRPDHKAPPVTIPAAVVHKPMKVRPATAATAPEDSSGVRLPFDR